jgi:general secretion pathway protein L
VLVIDGDTAALAYEVAGKYEIIGPVDLSAEDPGQAAALLGPGNARSGHTVAARLQLDPATALHIPMSLPLAALGNLGQVVEFEFERFSPFKRDAVYFRYRVVARDTVEARLDVELTIVPRDVVDDLRWRAGQNGLRITGIDVAGEPLPLPTDATNAARPPVAQRLVPFAVRVMCGLALLAAIGAVVVPFIQNSAAISELTGDLARARQEADASTKLQAAIDGEIHDQSFIIDRKKSRLTVTELLASLTHILPDDVWLTELQIDGDGIQLSGFAASATAVLGLLDQSPILSNATFRSSVTQDAQLNRERFDISAQLRAKPQL